mmetsp:Transcript_21020/g.58292  ORF Transcript_21020/g.58292 Transcript_21020/m.58292 type:complete len:200 (+) Transcript_21020:223-822(+)
MRGSCCRRSPLRPATQCAGEGCARASTATTTWWRRLTPMPASPAGRGSAAAIPTLSSSSRGRGWGGRTPYWRPWWPSGRAAPSRPSGRFFSPPCGTTACPPAPRPPTPPPPPVGSAAPSPHTPTWAWCPWWARWWASCPACSRALWRRRPSRRIAPPSPAPAIWGLSSPLASSGPPMRRRAWRQPLSRAWPHAWPARPG